MTCTLKAAIALCFYFVFLICNELMCVVYFSLRSWVNVYSEGTQSLSTFKKKTKKRNDEDVLSFYVCVPFFFLLFVCLFAPINSAVELLTGPF